MDFGSLLSVESIYQVVINTDARVLLEENGLIESERVVIRDRRDLCGDHVSMNLILEDDIRSTSADRYLMTRTTNPMLSSETIKRVLLSMIAD